MCSSQQDRLNAVYGCGQEEEEAEILFFDIVLFTNSHNIQVLQKNKEALALQLCKILLKTFQYSKSLKQNIYKNCDFSKPL